MKNKSSKVKLLMDENGIGQHFLCEKLNMAQSTFSRKVKYPSKFSQEQYETLAKIFNKNMDDVKDDIGNIYFNNVSGVGVANNNGEITFNSKELLLKANEIEKKQNIKLDSCITDIATLKNDFKEIKTLIVSALKK